MRLLSSTAVSCNTQVHALLSRFHPCGNSHLLVGEWTALLFWYPAVCSSHLKWNTLTCCFPAKIAGVLQVHTAHADSHQMTKKSPSTTPYRIEINYLHFSPSADSLCKLVLLPTVNYSLTKFTIHTPYVPLFTE